MAPYKLKNAQTVVTVGAGASVAKTLVNGRKTVVPSITCTATATIIFGGNSYTLDAGTHDLSNIELKQGDL